LSLVVRVGVVSATAMLAALSAVLIISFGVSALGQPEGIARIFEAVVATVAGFAFFLAGRAIWRDLRRRPPEAEKSFEKRER
jgi:hypothetical protein